MFLAGFFDEGTKQLTEWVKEGKLGEIMKVVVEYPQGYAITALYDQADGAISNWRMDPEVAGVSNCMADMWKTLSTLGISANGTMEVPSFSSTIIWLK